MRKARLHIVNGDILLENNKCRGGIMGIGFDDEGGPIEILTWCHMVLFMKAFGKIGQAVKPTIEGNVCNPLLRN